MDIPQLRTFIAVVDAGSMSKAARALGLTQPALSQQMSRLEASVSTRLLERTTRGVVPTRSGTEFYRGAHHLIQEFDQLARVTPEEHGVRGFVAVGLPSASAAHLAEPLFSWTRTRHPGIRLELFESMSGHVRELFDRGRMDIALLYTGEQAGTEQSSLLYSEELKLIVASDSALGSRESVTLEEVAQQPLVAPGVRSQLRSLIDNAFRGRGLAPTIVADVSSLSTMLRIARSGYASALLPRSAVDPKVAGYGSAVSVVDVIDAPLTRYARVALHDETAVTSEATAAVRDGIIACTRALADSDRWVGIHLLVEET